MTTEARHPRMPFIDALRQDARFAVRQLRRSPGFAVTAILTLALGVCASVAIYAFVDAALISPLPYAAPSRLVAVFERTTVFDRSNLSYLDYLDWKRMNTVFSSLSAFQATGMAVSTPDGARRGSGARVSDDFFRTLGVDPALGRDFTAGESSVSAAPVVILSDAAWRRWFGGRPDALGKSVTLDGTARVIVGVMPASFQFALAGPVEFWTPLYPASSCDKRRACHNLYGVARLGDGVSTQDAAAEMQTIAGQLEQQYPDSNRGQGSNIVPLTEAMVGGVRPMLIVLLIGAALLLLIASVNVAGLLLVRAEGRRREIAVRSALGASRARVAAQFVTEGALLVAAGGVLGLAAANWGIGLLQDLIPADVLARMTYLQGVGLNIRVIAFACGIALLAGILFAAIPMLHVRTASSRALAEGGRGSAGLGWRRLGARMVVVELATAMVLLTAASLLGRSLNALLRVDVGLRADGLATLQLDAPDRKYSDNAQVAAFQREVERSIAALPGVRQVGVSSRKPLAGGFTMWIRVVGRPYHGEHNEVHYREVSPGYFPALGAQLVRGRGITEADDVAAPAVVVVNEALVRTYFPNEDPLGQHLAYADEGSTPMEIVGILRDIKEAPLDETTPPTIYVAFAQDPTSGFTVFARTSVAPSSLVPAMTDAVRRIDPDVTTFQGRTMEDAIDDSPPAYLRRSVASLVGGFAGVAWLLGLIGLYGVIAYSVSQRTREIGVRVALGARPGSVYRLILREAGLVIGIGLAAGALFAVFGATLMRGLLFGVSAWDAPTLAAVGAALGVSALLASAVPARRAASVDPVDALRAE